jgi:hypothetical protein
MFLRGR